MDQQRDLLVLNRTKSDEADLAVEINELNHILHQAETLQSFCLAHEVIDVNRYKIISKPHIIHKYIKEYPAKAFVFICNKN
jgi:hypothetical protein